MAATAAGTLWLCLCTSAWLLCPSAGLQPSSPHPPLLRVLADRPGWGEGASRPSSRALRYMKRLYKLSATREGIPRQHGAGQRYNTARLFAPRAQCQAGGPGWEADVQSLDLSFNVGHVAALEQLLKSVLLYSVDRSYLPSEITCTCNLAVKEQEFPSEMCFHTQHSFALQLKHRQRWIEIDVTSLLEPLIASDKENLHLAVNFTCLNTQQKDPFNISLVPPWLLLYLNDTSEQAYHGQNEFGYRRKDRLWHHQRPLIEDLQGLDRILQVQRSPRHRRDKNNQGLKENPATRSYFNLSEYFKQIAFVQKECDLHSFRLSFSQLNWNKWIIAPHRYNPRYCKGECPRVVGHRYGSPVHTMVQNIIYEKVDSSVPRPSCVPAEYSPMSVLRIESDSSIVYKEYEDMIATKCTCR
ncbi:growth/differentiation factor 9 [Microcaecilia unicolor]|uniref:Growth/differentiation factor 9 n=1 Tax=Microcaecilia unicolor TaxID=1415580 RepID=A0A6P7YX56_9AMPH|nr:growth/differentiation factor 9 [Microcaecilia unicolor]